MRPCSVAILYILLSISTGSVAAAKDCINASDAPVPDVEIQSTSELSANLAPWLGHFKGAWYSQGEMAMCHRLVIHSIVPNPDSKTADVKVKYSFGTYPKWDAMQPEIVDWNGRINDLGELVLKTTSASRWSRIATYNLSGPDVISGTFAIGKGEQVHSGWTIVNTGPTGLVRQ